METKQAKLSKQVQYHRLSQTQQQPTSWGSKGVLFSNWDELKLNGSLFTFTSEATYTEWANTGSENLCIVEDGQGTLNFNGKEYSVKKGFALKIFPGQEPVIKPRGSLTFLSVQMPLSEKMERPGENLEELSVVEIDKVKSKVYEYETLGQEIFTPKYENSLGLLTFVFPLREIPFHIHPHSGRLIRTISGKGWTYAEPNVYEMNEDTFTLFPKGLVHTNGPVPGEVFRVYAIQAPWIESMIDEENIAGAPRFVKYVGTTPPRALWKTKQNFLNVLKRLSPRLKIR